METPLLQLTCPSCHTALSPTENFCSHCGAKLREPSPSVSVGRQVFVYLVSFFLAPFGLPYAYKYLRQSDPVSKRVGIVVIVLTLLSVLLMIWIGGAFARWEAQLLNNLNLL